VGVDLVEKCFEISPTRFDSSIPKLHFNVECELAKVIS
jgi:hypothetical protein